jgi:hypothetical protein
MLPPWAAMVAGGQRTPASRQEETVRSVVLAAGGGVCLGLFGVAAASANPVKSLYTTVELKTCKPIKPPPHGGAWLCEGLGGLPVYVAEGDLRQFLSVGANAQTRRAATQTLGASNTMFDRGSDRATIEWRFDRRGDKQIPYATIVRFHTSREGKRGDVLIVSKVGPADTCHVAYIDALANNNAIALARYVADTQAKAFDCRREPRAEGAGGKSPM